MDLEELRAFLAVVDTGSFLAAATSLGLSRTTLRRRVDALEARAGVTLLSRTPRGVVPSTAGELLARRGRLVLQDADQLVDGLRNAGPEPSGTLRLLLPLGMPPHLVAPWLASLRRRYPRLDVHLQFGNGPLGGLLDSVDVAVHWGMPSATRAWACQELLRVKEWLVASRDYLDKAGVPVQVEDLARHDLLVWQALGEDARIWPLRDGRDVTVEPCLIATDIHIVRQCAIHGMGIALLPDGMLPDPGVAPGGLVPVLPDVVGRERVMYVTAPRAYAEVPRIRAVVDNIRRAWAPRR